MKNLFKRLFDNEHLFETFQSCVSVTWFSIMLAGGDDAAFALSDAYRFMSMLAPNWAWLMIGLVASIAKVVGLLRDDLGLRKFGVGMTGIVWSIVGVSICCAVPTTMDWSVYLCMAGFALITYVKLEQDESVVKSGQYTPSAKTI